MEGSLRFCVFSTFGGASRAGRSIRGRSGGLGVPREGCDREAKTINGYGDSQFSTRPKVYSEDHNIDEIE